MLIGSNKLIINEATVIAVMQEYLNKHMNTTGKVKVVSFTASTNNPNGNTYEVSLIEEPQNELDKQADMYRRQLAG